MSYTVGLQLIYSAAVGAIMGFIFGSVNIMRYGAGPNGVMRSLGQYMLGSGATFGYVALTPPTLYSEVCDH